MASYAERGQLRSQRSFRAGALVFLAVPLLVFLSGCSATLQNSEEFYKDNPRRRINWRAVLSD